jgi:hypothetical protein
LHLEYGGLCDRVEEAIERAPPMNPAAGTHDIDPAFEFVTRRRDRVDGTRPESRVRNNSLLEERFEPTVSPPNAPILYAPEQKSR